MLISLHLLTVLLSVKMKIMMDCIAAWDSSFPGAGLCTALFHFMKFPLVISYSLYRSPFNGSFAVLSVFSAFRIVGYETHTGGWPFLLLQITAL